ncbi:hypothetical protein [Rhodococcus daqingensis]|uniref:Uncharacterized protein n=1 Tax=Rhodococcus daqingensis TaxID=2479363 RepID=A0ABW2RWS9_9NOCA
MSVIGTWARLVADHTGQTDALGDALAGRGLRQLVHNIRSRRLDRAALSTEAAHGVELAAVWLADYSGDMRSVPSAGVMYDEVTDALAYARRAVDRMPELAYKGPCPYTWEGESGEVMKCGADLYAERGGDWARCRWCGTQHDIRHLDRDMLAHMRELNYTVAELVTILGELGTKVSAGTVYSWANRRKLEPRGWRRKDASITDHWIHRNDVAVYRLGDAMELLVVGAPHCGA